MSARRTNPIERRLERLSDLWEQFAQDPSARILRWLVDEDEAELLNAWFDTHTAEGASDTPDLFFRFHAPFADPGRYGFDLASELREAYDSERDALQANGIAADYQFPAPRYGAGDAAYFVECCSSLRDYYKEVHILTAVLEPPGVPESRSFQTWLHRLLSGGIPEGVRLTFADHATMPVMGELARAAPSLVMTVEPRLNMSAAPSEVAEHAGNEGPGADYQRHFLRLANAGPGQDPRSMETTAENAAAIARQHGWIALEAAVYMLTAGLHFAAERPDHSIAGYRRAAATALSARDCDDPNLPKLAVQAGFGEGACLLKQRQFADAALVYERTAPHAEAAKDGTLLLEAWRMAGYCHEQARAYESAWRCNWTAWKTAGALDEAARQSSTLPYVGEALLRLCATPQYRGHRAWVEQQVAAGPPAQTPRGDGA